MPTLPQTEAWQVGPTVDSNRERRVPTWRQEPYEIPSAFARIDLRAEKPRPATHGVDHQLRSRSAIALTRMGNQNPAMAGSGDDSSIWSVSDPSMARLAGALGEGRGGMALPALLGVGVGFLIARMSR